MKFSGTKLSNLSITNIVSFVPENRWKTVATSNLASGTVAGAGFGPTTSITNDKSTVIVGLPSQTISTFSAAGSLDIFTGSGFSSLTNITSPAPINSGNFGKLNCISKDGSTIAVLEAGATTELIHVYSLSAGVPTLTATITTVATKPLDSVTINTDGTKIYIGAPSVTVGATALVGSVFVYQLISGTWSLVQTITPPLADQIADLQFGGSVCVTDDETLIGVAAIGKFYIINASDGSANFSTSFTPAVACFMNCSGDGSVFIGREPNATVSGLSSAGSTLVFTKSGSSYALTQTLKSDVVVSGGQFGTAGAISEDGKVIAIGEPGVTVGSAVNTGAVHMFTLDGASYTQATRISATTPASSQRFGSNNTIALSSDGLFLAMSTGQPGTSIGFLYTFTTTA